MSAHRAGPTPAPLRRFQRTTARAFVLRTLAFAFACTVPQHALAQVADTATVPRPVVTVFADTLTVGHYCAVVRDAMSRDAVQRVLADNLPLVEAKAGKVCDPRVAPLLLRSLTGRGAVSLAAVARQRQKAYSEVAAARLDTAMRTLRPFLRGRDVQPTINSALGDSAAQVFRAVLDAPALYFTAAALDRSLERLSRYERKLGLQSPKLNAVEVLLNYSAQRWVPGFAPSVTRGPSPFELIASYVPTYATVQNRKATAVSASEFGVRGYLFGDNWGKDGRAGILKPAYWSIGALVASDRNGALAWPWDGRTRTGAFVGWGELKIGYVPGRTSSVMVTRQMQFIPFVF